MSGEVSDDHMRGPLRGGTPFETFCMQCLVEDELGQLALSEAPKPEPKVTTVKGSVCTEFTELYSLQPKRLPKRMKAVVPPLYRARRMKTDEPFFAHSCYSLHNGGQSKASKAAQPRFVAHSCYSHSCPTDAAKPRPTKVRVVKGSVRDVFKRLGLPLGPPIITLSGST